MQHGRNGIVYMFLVRSVTNSAAASILFPVSLPSAFEFLISIFDIHSLLLLNWKVPIFQRGFLGDEAED